VKIDRRAWGTFRNIGPATTFISFIHFIPLCLAPQPKWWTTQINGA